MTPENEAKRLGLEYIGMNQVDIVNYGQDAKKGEPLYYFNDLETKSTLAVFDLSELEDKVIESRKKFKGE